MKNLMKHFDFNMMVLLIVFTMADVIMTAVSYNMFGGWTFESNGFIPSALWFPIALSIITIIIGSFMKAYGIVMLLMRTIAVGSHVYLWAKCLFVVPNLGMRSEPDTKAFILAIVVQIIWFLAVYFQRNAKWWDWADGTLNKKEKKEPKQIWGKFNYTKQDSFVNGVSYGHYVEHEDEFVKINIVLERTPMGDRKEIEVIANQPGVYYAYMNFYVRLAAERTIDTYSLFAPLKKVVKE